METNTPRLYELEKAKLEKKRLEDEQDLEKQRLQQARIGKKELDLKQEHLKQLVFESDRPEISQKIESLAEFEFPNEKNEVIKI